MSTTTASHMNGNEGILSSESFQHHDSIEDDGTCLELFGKLMDLESVLQYLRQCENKGETARMLKNILRAPDPTPSTVLVIIVICLFTVMMVFGSCGSAIVMYVVAKNSRMRTPRNVFIVSLALSDFSLCIFTQPFNLLRLFGVMWGWPWGEFLCKFTSFFQGTNIFASTLSITAIALDRFQVIVYPMRASMQLFGAMSIVAGIWILSILLASPLFLFSRLSSGFRGNYSSCVESNFQQMPLAKVKYSFVALVIQYLVPLIVVVVAYTRIYFRMRYRSINQQRFRLTGGVSSKLCVASSTTHKSNKKGRSDSFVPQMEHNFQKIEQDNKSTPSQAKRFSSLFVNNRRNTTLIEERSPSLVPEMYEENARRRSRFEHSRQRRANILLVFIAVIFALSWLPLNINNIIMDWHANTMEQFFFEDFFHSTIYNKTVTLIEPSFEVVSPTMTIRTRSSTDLPSSATRYPSLSKPNSTASTYIHSVADSIFLTHALCLIIALSSACANPVLYGWLNENFRAEFRKIFPCLNGKPSSGYGSVCENHALQINTTIPSEDALTCHKTNVKNNVRYAEVV